MGIKSYLFRVTAFLVLVAWLCLVVYKPAKAQTPPAKLGQEIVSRTAKESRPAPGMFCSQERVAGSFDEYVFVAVDESLITTENVRRCLKGLPKAFERTDEYTVPTMAEDLRTDEVNGLSCGIAKPVGRPLEFKILFAVPQLLKQEQIDSCFERARNGPNRLRIAPTKDA